MLLAHTEFLSRVSPASARNLIAHIREAKNSLAENPLQYPFADELDAPGIPLETYRKRLVDKRYKLLFAIEGDNEVLVDAIVDCRQENKDLL
jgi:plasmid stabilization system protein ParE